ncbi:unnamed protein product [Penicillium olsonii]|nr:unnamed protein product [Penicillium olsonii]
MTKRLPLSCENCRRRKIRCFGSGVPCDTCRKRGVASTCQFKRDVTQHPPPGPQQGQELLLKRIADLESLLQKNIELTTASNAQHSHTLRSPVSEDSIVSIQDELSGLPFSTLTNGHTPTRSITRNRHGEVGSIIASSSGHVRYVPYSTSRNPDVFHSLQSQCQQEPPPGGLLFSDTIPCRQSLLDMLPPFRHCDELITTFLNVFSPLFHILHDEVFQSNYLQLKQDPQQAPLSFIGLVFVALGLGVSAIDKESFVLADLGREASPAESAKSLAAKYRQAAMKCLAADNFMWQHNLHTVQCLVLLIYAINHAQGPAWSLLGTTLNIAIAIGCHIDPEILKLHPIEVQERRRAWAALMMLYTIQNSCLGNLAPFAVENSVQLPADVEDNEIFPSSFHEGLNETDPPLAPKGPTKMSYLLFKFRLYHLASDICNINTNSLDKIKVLDDQIEAEVQAQAQRFSEQRDLPTCHQAHSLILNNYTNHLILLLHRIWLLKPERLEDGGRTASYEKCEQAALAILSNFDILNSRHDLRPYSWYAHGLGAFHAFLAISTLLVLLGKPRATQTPRHLIWHAVQTCYQRFHDISSCSDICNRACLILDPLVSKEEFSLTQFRAFSDGGTDRGSTSVRPTSTITMDQSDQSDSFDSSLWSLPESFEDIVSKIPCEQWLSPAGFPWADQCPLDETYHDSII